MIITIIIIILINTNNNNDNNDSNILSWSVWISDLKLSLNK